MARLVDGPRDDALDGGVQGGVAVLGRGRDPLDASAAAAGGRGRRAEGGVGPRAAPGPGGGGGGGGVEERGDGGPAGRGGPAGHAAQARAAVGQAHRADTHDDGAHLLRDGGRVDAAHQQRAIAQRVLLQGGRVPARPASGRVRVRGRGGGAQRRWRRARGALGGLRRQRRPRRSRGSRVVRRVHDQRQAHQRQHQRL